MPKRLGTRLLVWAAGLAGQVNFGKLSIAAVYVLLVYISLLPFYYLPPVVLSGLGIPLAKYMPALLILISWCGVLKREKLKVTSLRLPPAHYFIVAFVLIAFVGLSGAEFPSWGLAKLVYFSFTGLGLAYLMVNLPLAHGDISSIIRVYTICSVLVAAYGLLELVYLENLIFAEIYALYNPYASDWRVSSTIGNPLVLSTFLLPGIIFCLYYSCIFSSHTEGKLWLFGFFIISACLFFTFSRSSIVTAFFIVLFFLLNKNLRKHLLSYRFFVFQSCVFLLLFSILLEALIDISAKKIHIDYNYIVYVFEKRFDFSKILEFDSNYWTYRLAQWGIVGRLLEEHFWLGIGYGNYTKVSHLYRPDIIQKSLVTTTDNMFLMVLAETGVLGLGAFCLLHFSVIKRQYRRCVSKARWYSELDFPLTLSLISLGVMYFAWDVLAHPVLRIFWGLLIGLGYCLSREEEKEKCRAV